MYFFKPSLCCIRSCGNCYCSYYFRPLGHLLEPAYRKAGLVVLLSFTALLLLCFMQTNEWMNVVIDNVHRDAKPEFCVFSSETVLVTMTTASAMTSQLIRPFHMRWVKCEYFFLRGREVPRLWSLTCNYVNPIHANECFAEWSFDSPAISRFVKYRFMALGNLYRVIYYLLSHRTQSTRHITLIRS